MDWFFDYDTEKVGRGPKLAPPSAHPVDQSVPGPAERVPADWQDHLRE
ncbi:MAG: hypothetical protein ACR2FG_02330 [Marmoricola sp.]